MNKYPPPPPPTDHSVGGFDPRPPANQAQWLLLLQLLERADATLAPSHPAVRMGWTTLDGMLFPPVYISEDFMDEVLLSLFSALELPAPHPWNLP